MRRTAFAVLLSLAAASCEDRGPRALVVVDGSGAAHAASVTARATQFEHLRARTVRVLPVGSPADAIQLARRGEADVALVPENAPLDDFVTASHGTDAGVVSLDGSPVRVLEVNAAQHPKVDSAGAKSLAMFFAHGE